MYRSPLAPALFFVGTAVAAYAPSAATHQRAPAVAYRVSAIRYATISGFPKRGLVAGADSAARTDIAMMVWLAQGPDHRNVLVDAGFYRDKFLRQWKPDPYERPSDAVARAGVNPADITDVIISHVHWDHLDGADLFPNARFWIQRAEFEHHLDSSGTVRNRAIDAEDARMLADLARAGRVRLVDGDSVELMPGIVAFTGGKHTFASQYVSVRSAAGTIVLASDNAYLYENLERHVPISQTLDPASNLAAQSRMMRLASNPRLIVPGHDPEVFVRFPLPGNGIALIQ